MMTKSTAKKIFKKRTDDVGCLHRGCALAVFSNNLELQVAKGG
jgi:hypothetical protein